MTRVQSIARKVLAFYEVHKFDDSSQILAEVGLEHQQPCLRTWLRLGLTSGELKLLAQSLDGRPIEVKAKRKKVQYGDSIVDKFNLRTGDKRKPARKGKR